LAFLPHCAPNPASPPARGGALARDSGDDLPTRAASAADGIHSCSGRPHTGCVLLQRGRSSPLRASHLLLRRGRSSPLCADCRLLRLAPTGSTDTGFPFATDTRISFVGGAPSTPSRRAPSLGISFVAPSTPSRRAPTSAAPAPASPPSHGDPWAASFALQEYTALLLLFWCLRSLERTDPYRHQAKREKLRLVVLILTGTLNFFSYQVSKLLPSVLKAFVWFLAGSLTGGGLCVFCLRPHTQLFPGTTQTPPHFPRMR
ncbi:hypothetical protein Taro_028368, partial [Colocasia esculenta]|nr:hypothetical protein [Colocasia esculenta]